MTREKGVSPENPTCCSLGVGRAPYDRIALAGAINVEVRCNRKRERPLGIRHAHEDAELFRGSGFCLPFSYCDRADCHVGRVYQRRPVDVACNVRHLMCVGIPGVDITVPPALECRWLYRGIARKRNKGH